MLFPDDLAGIGAETKDTAFGIDPVNVAVGIGRSAARPVTPSRRVAFLIVFRDGLGPDFLSGRDVDRNDRDIIPAGAHRVELAIDNTEARVAHACLPVYPELLRTAPGPILEQIRVRRNAVAPGTAEGRPLTAADSTAFFNRGEEFLILKTQGEHFDETGATVGEFEMHFPVLYLDQFRLDCFAGRGLFPSPRDQRHGHGKQDNNEGQGTFHILKIAEADENASHVIPDPERSPLLSEPLKTASSGGRAIIRKFLNSPSPATR